MAKYLGNKICWHWPNIWRGNEKYNESPAMRKKFVNKSLFLLLLKPQFNIRLNYNMLCISESGLLSVLFFFNDFYDKAYKH